MLTSNKILLCCYLIAVLLISSCQKAPDPCQVDPNYLDDFDSDIFLETITEENPYFPLNTNRTLIYQGDVEGGIERVELTFSSEIKTILNVNCRVVTDLVYYNNELIERTRSYYALDESKNVWIFGEESSNYNEGRQINQFGSWETGVNGAVPGYYMKAQPTPGQSYKQGFRLCDHEDMAEDIKLDEVVLVPYGSFDQCLKTREWNLFEPDQQEYKYYAEGIGLVKSMNTDQTELMELIDIQ